jgi:hypothetical protein
MVRLQTDTYFQRMEFRTYDRIRTLSCKDCYDRTHYKWKYSIHSSIFWLTLDSVCS